MIIDHDKEGKTLKRLLTSHPAVGIIGARQVGKTTLANMLAKIIKKPVTHFDFENQEDMESHPKLGATWEGFVIDQVIRTIGAQSEECFFWATHAGAELDLLVVRGMEKLGFEVKRTTSPTITPSMRNALSDLNLQRIDIIHSGDNTFQLADKVRAVSIKRI